MTDYYKGKQYFVYRHIVPDGKMYVGITSKSRPELRWGSGGKAYSKNNKHFWYAIQKYGWDNIQHIVVAHGLNVEQACRLEAYLIQKYDSFNHGYNQTTGGIYPTEVTEEIRQKIGERIRAYHETLPNGVWSSKFKGHSMPESARRRQSAKLKGRKIPKDVIQRRVETFKSNLTPEIRYKFGSSRRGKCLSESQKQKLREVNTGKVVKDSTRKLISENAKHRFATKHIWVHLGNRELEIPEQNLEKYLSEGYSIGRSNIKNIYLTKDGAAIKVSSADLDAYLADGWVRGFSPSRYENMQKSQRKFRYLYKGMEFPTGKSLALYLRSNGYPKIVQGTVNLICKGAVISAYPELSTEITRKLINENI